MQLSTAKFLPPEQARDLEAARTLALEWERTGVPARPSEYVQANPPSPVAPEDSNNVTVERAVAAFMADSRDRGNSDATLQKKATVFERRTARHCDQKGIRFLSELDLNTIRDWRSDWKVNSLVRQKRQGQVIAGLSMGHLLVKSIQCLVDAGEHEMTKVAAYFVWQNTPRQEIHEADAWSEGERQMLELIANKKLEASTWPPIEGGS